MGKEYLFSNIIYLTHDSAVLAPIQRMSEFHDISTNFQRKLKSVLLLYCSRTESVLQYSSKTFFFIIIYKHSIKILTIKVLG